MTGQPLQAIERTATIEWSPNPHSSGKPLLATATAAGALDASFSSSCHLEIFEMSMDNSLISRSLVSTTAPARFNRLAWSSHADEMIIGGLEDGSVCFWNATKLLAGTPTMVKKDIHHGPVKGLSVNPLNPCLVCSGSVDSEVSLWDLNDLSKLFQPGNSKSSRLEQVTDVSWNRIHAFIVAASSSNGNTTIWDLRSRREIAQLPSRHSVSSIAWSPDEATSIVTASDDNSFPVISIWDLRNANAPDKQLTNGHSRGILSVSWCPQDSELLLSCGKDDKICFWNPKTGTELGGFQPSSNWTYELHWWPRNPDLFAAASLEGKVNVYSYQSVSNSTNALPTDILGSAQQAEGQNTIRQIPKWLKRPISASFGFGGCLLMASGKRTSILAGAAEPGLDSALESGNISQFCSQKVAKDPVASAFWKVMEAIFTSSDFRTSILSSFGVTIEKQEEEETSQAEANLNSNLPSATSSQAAAISSLFDFGSQNSNFDLNTSPPVEESQVPLRRKSTFCGAPFTLYPDETSEEDRQITRAIIAGSYSKAVDCCIRANRLSDAILVALCGGPQLMAKTQRLYFQKVPSPYLRVVSGILKKDLSDVVQNVSIEDWKDIMALICAKATNEELSKLGTALADRIASEAKASDESLLQGAILGYVFGGDAIKAAAILLKNAKKSFPANNTTKIAQSIWLEALVDRVRTVHYAASKFTSTPVTLEHLVEQFPELYRYFLLYVFILEEKGKPASAASLLAMIGVRPAGNNEVFFESLKDLGYRLSQLTMNTNLNFATPFEAVEVHGEPLQTLENKSASGSYSKYYGSGYGSTTYGANAAYDQNYPAQSYAPQGQTYGTQATPYQTQSSAQYSNYQQPTAASQYSVNSAYGQAFQPQQGASQGQFGAQYSSVYQSNEPQQSSQLYSNQPQQQTQYSQYPQQQQSYTPPAIPKPSIPVPGPISSSPVPVISTIPSTVPSQPSAPPAPIGAFNDAPFVAPKVSTRPVAPITSPVRQVQLPDTSNQIAYSASTIQPHPAQYPQQPLQHQPLNPAQTTQSTSQSARASVSSGAPVDPSTIGADLKPIYLAFNSIIGQCMQKITPEKRHTIEDSVRRLQGLVSQLANRSLSPQTVSSLHQVARSIQEKKYDEASSVCSQLMASAFGEVGQWIMAARRLIAFANPMSASL